MCVKLNLFCFLDAQVNVRLKLGGSAVVAAHLRQISALRYAVITMIGERKHAKMEY